MINYWLKFDFIVEKWQMQNQMKPTKRPTHRQSFINTNKATFITNVSISSPLKTSQVAKNTFRPGMGGCPMNYFCKTFCYYH